MVAKKAADRLLKKKLVIRFIVELCPNVQASSDPFNPEGELEAMAEARSRLKW